MGLFKKLKFWNNRNVKEDKASQALKKQLEEERRQIYEEERWILQKWMGAKEELEQVKAENDKLRRDYEQQVRAVQHLKNELLEEGRKHSKELLDLSKAPTVLEDIRAENEKLRRDYDQQVRAVQQLKDQLRQDRRKHVHQVEGLLEDLCKAYTELEEIKAKQSAPNSQPAANAIEPQEGHQVLTFMRVLGEGAFGKVVLAQCKEDFYAVKVLRKRDIIKRKCEEEVMRERDILKLVSGNPFVINLHCCYQTEALLFFVMELAHGGDLRSKLNLEKTFTQTDATFYAAEIALALQFLHKKGIVHRDLKPENILLDKEGHIKVTDFGLSISGLFEGDKTRGLCGTAAYVAPEMAKGLKYKHDVDWWALGIMIYEMLLGSTPFESYGGLQSIEYYEIRYPEFLSKEAESILQGVSMINIETDKLKSYH